MAQTIEMVIDIDIDAVVIYTSAPTSAPKSHDHDALALGVLEAVCTLLPIFYYRSLSDPKKTEGKWHQ